MSNFLTNLIARASQQAPVLQRRQAALFESVTPWSLPLEHTGDVSGVAAVAVQPIGPATITSGGELNSTHEQNPSQTDQAHLNQKDFVPFARSASLLPSAPRAVDPVVNATKDAINNNLDSQIATTVPNTEAIAEGDHARDSHRVLPIAQPSPDESSVSVHSFLTRQPSPSLIPETLQSKRAVVSQAGYTSTQLSGKARQRHEETATGVLVPAAPKITQAVQLANMAQPHAAVSFSSTNTEKDVVQITIGRVEVRAVTGGERPAARAANPTTPRLKLDDYLRERSGGRP